MKSKFNSIVFSILFITLSSFNNTNLVNPSAIIVQNSCEASQNLDETCRSFISRCRKGGINSEFPGQFYDMKIRIVKDGTSATHNKAWKLLNDNRFKK